MTDASKSLNEAYHLRAQIFNQPFDSGTIESGNTLIDGGKKEERGGKHHVHQYDYQTP